MERHRGGYRQAPLHRRRVGRLASHGSLGGDLEPMVDAVAGEKVAPTAQGELPCGRGGHAALVLDARAKESAVGMEYFRDFVHGLGWVAVGGGVAANSGLRQHLQAAAAQHNLRVLFPPLEFCTDNAAMIACAAAEHFNQGERSPLTLGVLSRMPMSNVMQLYTP